MSMMRCSSLPAHRTVKVIRHELISTALQNLPGNGGSNEELNTIAVRRVSEAGRLEFEMTRRARIGHKANEEEVTDLAMRAMRKLLTAITYHPKKEIKIYLTFSYQSHYHAVFFFFYGSCNYDLDDQFRYNTHPVC